MKRGDQDSHGFTAVKFIDIANGGVRRLCIGDTLTNFRLKNVSGNCLLLGHVEEISVEFDDIVVTR
jgi:hypothetical protein